MRVFSFAIIFLAITFVSTSYVAAQEATVTPNQTKRIETIPNKEERMGKKSEIELRVSQNRLEVKKRISSKSAAFKEKLKTIRDTKKKEIVERVQIKLAGVNEKRTLHYTKVLARLTVILERMKEKRPDADTIAAEEAIATAQEAVDAQGSMEYVPTISTEGALRQTVGQSMSQLQNDLQDTKALVQAAKKAVMEVARTQQGEKEHDNEDEDTATSSGEVQE